jgi:hypothetical protein
MFPRNEYLLLLLVLFLFLLFAIYGMIYLSPT